MKNEEKRPKVGLGIILMRDSGQVLLGKRKGAHGEGSWSFPGGHLEYMESFVDCAQRELEEETGLIEDNYSMIDLYPTAITNDFFKEENKHYITLYMRAKYLSGIPVIKEEDKCEEWRWFYWNQFPRLSFLPVGNLLKQHYNPFTKK